MLRNLIENALLHGRAEEPVDIRLEKGGVVRIVNGAAPLAPGELEPIRKRFGRGNTGSPGFRPRPVDRRTAAAADECPLRGPVAGNGPDRTVSRW